MTPRRVGGKAVLKTADSSQKSETILEIHNKNSYKADSCSKIVFDWFFLQLLYPDWPRKERNLEAKLFQESFLTYEGE